MHHRLLVSALVLGSLALGGLGCSALVSPDTSRLGGDSGPSSSPNDAAVIPGIDSGMPGVCGAGQLDCGGTCVDPSSDPNHCGSCAMACGAGQNCVSGVCSGGGGCPTGLSRCNGACVDLRRDPANCGDCGNTCSRAQLCLGQCRTVTMPAACTSCPCDACNGGSQCCTYPGLATPVCIDGVDFCPR